MVPRQGFPKGANWRVVKHYVRDKIEWFGVFVGTFKKGEEMSKRALKKYLHGLKKVELEDQILDLYERFKEVKAFYNFAFNPKEEKLMDEAKFKISREYFPLTRRRPKMRRSVAQKLIKQFITLGVEPHLTAEIMLYNIEIAQIFCKDRSVRPDSFYKSILNSFEEALLFIRDNAIKNDFDGRLEKIVNESDKQKWINAQAFHDFLEPPRKIEKIGDDLFLFAEE